MKPADEVEPDVDPTEVPTSTRSLRRRILQGLLSFALAGAVLVFVLPQVADLSEVWSAEERKFRSPQDWLVAVLRALDALDAGDNIAPLLRQLRHPL